MAEMNWLLLQQILWNHLQRNDIPRFPKFIPFMQRGNLGVDPREGKIKWRHLNHMYVCKSAYTATIRNRMLSLGQTSDRLRRHQMIPTILALHVYHTYSSSQPRSSLPS